MPSLPRRRARSESSSYTAEGLARALRFLADEHFPRPSIRALSAVGHDVADVASESPGIPDERVLERAVREGRLLITFDSDHGRLIYREGGPVPVGVVYFRLVPLSVREPAEYLLALLARPELSLLGMLTVVERERIRQRPLP